MFSPVIIGSRVVRRNAIHASEKSVPAGLRKERLDRLHRLGDAWHWAHQFVVAMDNDVDLVAECFAGEDVGTLNLAHLRG